MATDKNRRPVEDVVGALFAKDTDGSIDRASDSEEDVVLEGENDPPFSSPADGAAAAKTGDDGNDFENSVGQPAKRKRKSSTDTKIRTPGPTIEAMSASVSPSGSWDLLFTEEILREIVTNTNHELGLRRSTTDVAPSYYHDTTREEIRAFLGLLYFAGVQKTRDTNVEEMWSVKWGWSLYRATMPSKRFELLSRILRFDDRVTRPERRETDKFAPIRSVWQIFFANCEKCYVPHEDHTVDELFVPFGGRCPFKVHVSGQTEKYGIKIFTVSDPRTFYVCNASPYIGKKMPGHELPENISVRCVAKSAESKDPSNLSQMCREFTTARKTAGWPMKIWMAMLDLGAINAMILHNFNTTNERMNRPKFLKTLAVNLVDEHLRHRIAVPSLRRDLRIVIEKILNVDVPTDFRRTNLLEKRARCNLCPRGKDRKTRHACYCCGRPICDEHRASVCADCCTRD